jgi:hypothetical protein
MGTLNAKELHEYIVHNCLHCQHYETCQKLADLRKQAQKGVGKSDGRCEEFKDRGM